MNTQQLLRAFEDWRSQGQELVLATVYETAGSTYSKAGAQMLIDNQGNFQGMLSGGCLEGDLAERAAAVLQRRVPQAHTFDLGAGDDDLWGLGVGCDGLMRVFLQPLSAGNGYEPFASVAAIYAGDAAGALATVISSNSDSIRPGACLSLVAGRHQADGMPEALQEALAPRLTAAAAGRTTMLIRESLDGAEIELLLASVLPPPRVLVLGGGLDAPPLVRLMHELGWRVTVQDHRPLYIERGDFRGAAHTCVPAEKLAVALDLDAFDAAVVMSHHLATDRIYLELLAETRIPYVGLLGPAARRERLLRDLETKGDALRARLHGPAGLDLGGRGPAAIAVSIVAEMLGHLMARVAAT